MKNPLSLESFPRSIRTFRMAAFLALLSFLIAFLPIGRSSASSWKGKIVEESGVVHVKNPSQPMEASVSVDLKELWRVGGDTDDEDQFFGLISRIVTDSKGNVYLLDTQLSQVKVFSPDGQFIRTMGRAGEGPGEFNTPTGMFFTPEGNIAVLQVAPGRIVLLTPEGEPAGEMKLPESEDAGFLMIRDGLYRNGNLVLSLSKNSFLEGKFSQLQYLCSLDKEGKEKARYIEDDIGIDFANPVMSDERWSNFTNRWTLGHDGRVFAAPSYDKYEINVWKPDGSLDRVVEVDYKPQKRTEEELEIVRKIMEVYTRQVPNAKIKVSDYNSCIERLFTRDDGSLWVVSSRGARPEEEGILASFDVFDEQGRYVKQVKLRAPGDALTDGFYFTGNRFYVVTSLLQAAMTLQAGGQSFQLGEEEPEPMAVICYELPEDLNLEMTSR